MYLKLECNDKDAFLFPVARFFYRVFVERSPCQHTMIRRQLYLYMYLLPCSAAPNLSEKSNAYYIRCRLIFLSHITTDCVGQDV